MDTNCPKNDMETDAELIDRFCRVKSDHQEALAKLNKMKLGHARSRKALWIGCIAFNLASIRTEIEERGLKVNTVYNDL